MTDYTLIVYDSAYDPSAALFNDDTLIALGEEERFSRNKHAFNELPIQSVNYCLDETNIDIHDVDKIVHPWDAQKYPLEMAHFYLDGWHKYDKDERTLEWEKNNLKTYQPDSVIDRIRESIPESDKSLDVDVTFVDHHRAHAASAYHLSNFDSTAVLTADGHGEKTAVAGWHADGNIKKVFSYEIPNSLGWFYSSITAFLGFRPNNGEGKVMGLAPYGEPDSEIEQVLSRMLSITDDGFSIDPSYIYYGNRSHHEKFTDKLVDELGEPREHPEEITEFHKNVAYCAQNLLESALLSVSESLLQQTGEKNLCLAGGVLYNCKANKVLREQLDIHDFFVQPIAGEPGATIGAGYLVQEQSKGREMTDVYYGWGADDQDLSEAIEVSAVEVVSDERKETRSGIVDLLAEQNVVARYNGRSECGPRALGNRSILADPSEESMLKEVNKIKRREQWRPFAPTILANHARDILDFNRTPNTVRLDSFMIQTFDVNPDEQDLIKATVHVDGTTRPQILSEKNNEDYWNLIREFYEETGVPALLNTSFNLSGDPIVRTPKEAIETYIESEIDALQLGKYLVQ